MARAAVQPAWGRSPLVRRDARRPAVLALLSLTACGGAAPLLHPAQTLPVDTISVGAGVSGQFTSSALDRAIDDGRSAAAQPLTNPGSARAYAEGVLADALLGPGASPWVSARVGLPANTEAGLTYTGRSLRLDGRYARSFAEQWTIAAGLGVTGLVLAPDDDVPQQPVSPDGTPGTRRSEFEPSALGWGLDVPVLVGYHMVEGFGDVWAGPRVGFERLDGDLRLGEEPSSARVDWEGSRIWAGLVAGFSLGVPPLWLRFELATTYHRLSGSFTAREAAAGLEFGSPEASGWTLTPSGAIVGKF